MRGDRRRDVLLALGVVLCVAAGCRERESAPLAPEPWRAWCAAHLRPDGRVVDDRQGGITHSEGQAYGMLLATAWRDEEAFERIRRWTFEHLAVRDDGLLAWRWEETVDGAGGRVTDRNNATDADLVAAWALARAAESFDRDELRDEARGLARAVRTRLLRETPYGPVLLPGAEGFEHDGVVTVNLSYWIWPAFDALRRLDPSPTWNAVERSGRMLLALARFGDDGLPADWIAIGPRGGLAPAERFPPRFGWDAIRIPLYLVWAGETTPERLRPFVAFWDRFDGAPPAWIDLVTGEIGGPAPPGFDGVRRLARCALVRCGAIVLPDRTGGGYYSETLLLLARVAAREDGPA